MLCGTARRSTEPAQRRVRTWASCDACVRAASSNAAWINKRVNDPYVKAAAVGGYRSRAAFKLLDIQEKCRVLKASDAVVDLGCAPGGWLQVVTDICTPRVKLGENPVRFANTLGGRLLDAPTIEPARRVSVLQATKIVQTLPKPSLAQLPLAHNRHSIVGVDLLSMKPIAGASLIMGDFTESKCRQRITSLLPHGVADVILSDMAHNFTGNAAHDNVKQMILAWTALAFASKVLREHGNMLVKVRNGLGYSEFLQAMERRFVKTATIKPPASRSESAEIYLVGLRARPKPVFSRLSAEEHALLDGHGIEW